MFAPGAVWNTPIAADAPLDPESEVIAAAVAKSARERATINTTSWSVPVYSVGDTQPLVKVTQENEGKLNAAMNAAMQGVPLPPDAKAAQGTDKHLVVVQASADRMWEFWGLQFYNGAWFTAWGGAMDQMSQSQGFYDPTAWPGATKYWGASATSLPLLGGLMTLAELGYWGGKPRLPHALSIALPIVRKGAYAWPAQRDDGRVTTPGSIPEGARLRLDPTLNLAGLGLPPFTLLIAEAAQRYGMYVRDFASNVALYAQDPTPLGVNPYTAAGGIFGGLTPQKILAAFPWEHLQVMKMTLTTS